MNQRSSKYGIQIALNGTKKSQEFLEKNIRVSQKEIYQLAVEHFGINHGSVCGKKTNVNNSITRHLQDTCHHLDELERLIKPDITNRFRLPSNKHFMRCYQCHKLIRSPHPTYLFCCFKCGELNQRFRGYSRSLHGLNALVTGGRTKLGHQIALKLLRANCKNVVVTTRNIDSANKMFSGYCDYSLWKNNLKLIELDLDLLRLDKRLDILADELEPLKSLDILVNCAAQTIRARDKSHLYGEVSSVQGKNRYGDPKFVDHSFTNSWHVRLTDFLQQEAEECYRINAVAPVLLIQKMLPLLNQSLISPYIINVHAREGLFKTKKEDLHLQTNMAKSALHMLTKCLARKTDLLTKTGKRFSIHGCDPGWFSVDEYYESDSPWIVPPLDEIDGAARILFPIFTELSGCSPTRRHFYQLSY